MKWQVCILSNENPIDHELWISAIKKNNSISDYDIVDLTSDKWLKSALAKPYDIFILKPPGRTNLFKQLYDERVLLISQYL